MLSTPETRPMMATGRNADVESNQKQHRVEVIAEQAVRVMMVAELKDEDAEKIVEDADMMVESAVTIEDAVTIIEDAVMIIKDAAIQASNSIFHTAIAKTTAAASVWIFTVKVTLLHTWIGVTCIRLSRLSRR